MAFGDSRHVAVLVSVTMVVSSTSNTSLYVRPTIDGVGFDNDPQLAQSIGELYDGERRIISFSRAYHVTPGPHAYGLEWGCTGNASIISGSLTVTRLN